LEADMGMFDNIICKYKLPLKGANRIKYQTKDTEAQFLDNYEIREDGTLWHEVYDTEDRSPASGWKKRNPSKKLPERYKGLKEIMGCMTRINPHMVFEDRFIGEIRFYGTYRKSFIEWSSYFKDGKLMTINQIMG